MNSKIKIEVLAPLSQYTGNQRILEYPGQSVKEVIGSLVEEYPKLGEQLFTPASTSLRDFINIFVNGEDIRNLGGLDAVVNANDRITIIPAIAGG